MNITLRLTKSVNTNLYDNDTIELDLEEYTAISSATEMGGAPVESHKAQSIAIRTNAYYYAMQNKSITDASPQAFNGTRTTSAYKNAQEGAQSTRGLVLYYNGKIAYPASFSSNNGGTTVSSKERWGGDRPWLLGGKKDPWDRGSKTGHGVGLSQVSTTNQVQAGRDYKQILAFYYNNTYLHNIYTNEDIQLSDTIDVIEKEDDIKVGNIIGSAIVTTSSGNLNVRSGPSTSNTLLGRIPRNSKVDLYNEQSGWYYVKYKNLNGWVSGSYLVLIDNSLKNYTININAVDDESINKIKSYLSSNKINYKLTEA